MTGRTEDVATAILYDSRKMDKRANRSNDLTKEYIRDLLSNGCSYCEERDLRLTLDRIDNSLGHTVGNVVAACIRCNNIRKDMPYQAWIQIARNLKEVRLSGAFGSWTGGFKKF